MNSTANHRGMKVWTVLTFIPVLRMKVWTVLILALAASHTHRTVCDEALAFVPAGLRLSGAKMRGYRDCSIAKCSCARRGIGRVRIAGGLLCTGGEGGEGAGSLAATRTKGKVKCIFSDVDGTLLDKHHRLQPETQQAILDAVEAGIPFIMATGKSRGPWVQELRRQLGFNAAGYSLNGPGVFIQGLLVCNQAGEAVQQLLLTAEVIATMNAWAAERGLSLVAYTTDDRIVCARTDEHTDKIIPFNEPVPDAIGQAGMRQLSQPSNPGVYKMMLMADEADLAPKRSDLERALVGKASVVKAMDGMLEILPLGASKWSGVRKVLVA